MGVLMYHALGHSTGRVSLPAEASVLDSVVASVRDWPGRALHPALPTSLQELLPRSGLSVPCPQRAVFFSCSPRGAQHVMWGDCGVCRRVWADRVGYRSRHDGGGGQDHLWPERDPPVTPGDYSSLVDGTRRRRWEGLKDPGVSSAQRL